MAADPTERALVARAAVGDPDAWRELYRAHAGRLLVWLQSRPTGDAAVSADDVAAEAWLTAARTVASFDGSDDQFVGWLFGVARNVGLNTYRRSDRRATVPVAGVPDRATTHDTEALAGDLSSVLTLLAPLSARERDVLVCTEVLDLDAAATARALGIASTAVRVARHRGLRRLRSLAGVAEVPSVGRI
ncbi:MAG: sigma-70 family RNA polymerase sigma factor [Actinobacteria bacterium]|uniref:Unannotated protein n=1 Tax=freshwater metagenome TaxID=449393 RepID=A0A6J6NTM6_9ZZZZ|nr:sigma-70 family RNA polymerase sigma factor [Actinomycetota bacterium]